IVYAMKYEALCSLSISRGIRPLIGASFYIKDKNIIESYLFTDSWSLNLLKNVLDVYEIIKIIIPEDMSMLEKRLDTIIECDLEGIERVFFSPQIDFIPDFQPDNFFIKSSIFSLIMVYNISNHSIKLKIHPRRMFISQESITDLDLVDKKISLYKIIKNTNTKMGERLLKDNIMQPLINLEEIEERHQLLLFLQENKIVKNNINTVLNTFIDIDQFLQDIENTYNDCNNKIKYLTSILKHKALLSDIDEIFNILKDIKN
ncbi:MUTS DNA mismatch repair protein-like protein, partial [Spraguea lophii 42_110]